LPCTTTLDGDRGALSYPRPCWQSPERHPRRVRDSSQSDTMNTFTQ
jgi:hypothetical protein